MKTLKKLHRNMRGSADLGILGIIAVIAVIVFVVGGVIYWMGSTASAESNQVCVVYSGGTFTDKEFQEILPPGTTNAIIGWGSKSRCYENDQRSYIASNREGADMPPISVTCRADDVVQGGTEEDAANQVSVDFDVNMYFSLNTSEAKAGEDPETGTIVVFDREIGRKTKANTREGWREMLRDYMEPQVIRAMQDAGNSYSCLELAGSAKVRAEYQKDVVELFRKYLKTTFKGEYFCQPTFTGKGDCGDISLKVSKPTLPETVQKTIEDRIAARQETATQIERNNTSTKKLIVDDELIKRYGPEGALLYKAIESGKVQIMVLPNGQSVAVPAPGK